ncbi:Serine/threonine-protein kinase PknD [compost metagenome]
MGDGAGAVAQFQNPSGIAVDGAGNVYVADTWNNRIRMITPGGMVKTMAGSTFGFTDGSGSIARFGSPTGIAVRPDGTLFIADFLNNLVRKLAVKP